MQLRDESILAMRLDSNEFDTKLSELNNKAKTLKATLKDIEANSGKGSEDWKKYKAELKETEGEARKLAASMKTMDVGKMTLQQLETHAKQLNKELKGMERGTAEYISTAKRIGDVERETKKATDETKRLKGATDDMGKPSLWQKITTGVNGVGGAFRAFMALQVIGYIIEIGRAVFEATAKMEKYEKVLTTALGGNNKAAKESLAAIKEMAKDTVFTVDQLTEGYVKMVNRGLRPSKAEMVALADLAASQGKTFDQLVEGVLDASTAEFERLKEFGMRGSKAGEEVAFKFKDAALVIRNTGKDFEVVDKATGKVVNTFKNQEQATLGVMTALGQMQGVAGQNKNMMETLDGRTSNLQDSFFELAAELGQNLRPVFISLMGTIQTLMPVLRFLGQIGATVLVSISSIVQGVMSTLQNAWKGLSSLVSAGKALLQGDLDGAKKFYQEAGTYSQAANDAMAKNVADTRKHISDIWNSKQGAIDAKFAGNEQGGNYQGGLTDQQTKGQKERAAADKKAKAEEEKRNQEHLEQIKKDNEEALKMLAELEEEAFVEEIRRKQGDVAAEKVKLQQKLDAQLTAINSSLASQERKDLQAKLLTEKFHREVAALDKKAAEKTEEEAQKLADKLHQQRLKTFEKEKYVLGQVHKAEKALLDLKELEAGNNKDKLLQIKKERLDAELRWLKENLAQEKKAEEEKINHEIKDEGEKVLALKKLNDAYREREIAEEQKTAKAKSEIDEKAIEEREKRQRAWSGMFVSLLKGDLAAFAGHVTTMVGKELKGNQLAVAEFSKKYDQYAEIAKEGINFLMKLANAKSEREIAIIQKNYAEQKALLDKQLEDNATSIEAAEAKIQELKEQSSEKIKDIKSREQERVKQLEDEYRKLTTTDAKKAIDDQLDKYKENAAEQTKLAQEAAKAAIEAAKSKAAEEIEAAKEAKEEAIQAAQQVRKSKVMEAEASRDAEIESIKKRSDFDSATKAKLIKEANEKFQKEKQLAEDEFEVKRSAAQKEAEEKISYAKKVEKQSVELAESKQKAELDAIKAVLKGDAEAAKAILQRQKEDQKEQIRLAKEEAKTKVAEAQKEADDKMKILLQEKAKKVQEKKDLERKLLDETKKAKKAEYDIQLKMWKNQQKADIATALINAAGAAIKAFTLGPIVGLAMSIVIGAMAAVQIANIKKQQPPPPPSFQYGGQIKGSKHGSKYGDSGIALIDRHTGHEVGEMEGDEYIVPADQTALHLPFLSDLSRRSRAGIREPAIAPGRAFRHGGMLEYPYWQQDMYLFGGKKKKAQREAEAAAAAAAESAQSGEIPPEALAAQQAASEQAQKQIDLLEDIKAGVTMTNENLAAIAKNTADTVGATVAVRDAVNAANTNGKMDALIDKISKLG